MALKDLIVRGPKPTPKREVGIAPIHIDGTSWMYPLKNGLHVVHEFRDKDQYIRTDTVVIKWVDVGTALERRKMFRRPYPKRRPAGHQ